MLNIVELDMEIMCNLPYRSILDLSLINRQMSTISNSEFFWKRRVIEDFGPIIETKSERISHKKFYRNLYDRGYPQQLDAEHAASSGRVNEIERLLRVGIYPTLKGVNWASKNGHLKALEFLYDRVGIVPDNIGVEWAKTWRRQEILDWLEGVVQSTF